MNKKGQLTIFIIVAIFLIGSVLIYFAFQQGLIQKPLNPNAEIVYNFVQTCIEGESIETIYQIGENGGYFFPPNLSLDSGVPIYYENGQNLMPSKEQVEDEISFFMNEKIFLCVNDFIQINSDLNISQDDINTKIEIIFLTIEL